MFVIVSIITILALSHTLYAHQSLGRGSVTHYPHEIAGICNTASKYGRERDSMANPALTFRAYKYIMSAYISLFKTSHVTTAIYKHGRKAILLIQVNQKHWIKSSND